MRRESDVESMRRPGVDGVPRSRFAEARDFSSTLPPELSVYLLCTPASSTSTLFTYYWLLIQLQHGLERAQCSDGYLRETRLLIQQRYSQRSPTSTIRLGPIQVTYIHTFKTTIEHWIKILNGIGKGYGYSAIDITYEPEIQSAPCEMRIWDTSYHGFKTYGAYNTFYTITHSQYLPVLR